MFTADRFRPRYDSDKKPTNSNPMTFAMGQIGLFPANQPSLKQQQDTHSNTANKQPSPKSQGL